MNTTRGIANVTGESDPVFDEPWEAHAFALAVRLSEAGHFTWQEWTRCLALEISDAKERCDPEQKYYQLWLAALEKICVQKGLTTSPAMTDCKERWRQACLHTPHGKPVELPAANPHPLPAPRTE